jgi:hypothetical protein
MKRSLGWLVAGCVLALAGSYTWSNLHHPAYLHRVAEAVAAPAAPQAQAETSYPEVREAQQIVGVTGPLADYVMGQKPAQVETLKPIQLTRPAQPASPVSQRPGALDRVGESPVGTSNAILHQTFRVAGIVNLPFAVPAHAANPQLRGTYRSFLKAGGKQTEAEASDAAANVDFLVLNEQQYSDYLNGRGGEAIFSVEDAHNQEVNMGLPPTLGQPAKYYLVFRNNSRTAAKTVVQADFRVDF